MHSGCYIVHCRYTLLLTPRTLHLTPLTPFHLSHTSLTPLTQAIVEDILQKSGLARPGTSTYGSTYMSVNGHKPEISAAVASAVEVYALDRLCKMLLTGESGWGEGGWVGR